MTHRPSRRQLAIGALGLLCVELMTRLLLPLFMTVYLSLMTGEVSTLGQHASMYVGLAMAFSLTPIPYPFLFVGTTSHVLEFGIGLKGIAPAFWHIQAMAIGLTFVYPAVVATVVAGYAFWRRR